MAGATVRAVVRWRAGDDTPFIMVRQQGGGPWEEFQNPSLAATVAKIIDRADAAELLAGQGVAVFDARTSARHSTVADLEFLEFGEPEPEGFLAVGTDGVHVGRVYANPEELDLDTDITRPADLHER